MPKLEPGTPAPPFELPDQDGKPVSLADFQGSKVIVYFYPADETPGCTREACQFNDNLPAFQRAAVPVLGISPDDAATHRRFRSRYDLVGVLRSTFLIDEQGRVQRAWYNVKADGHAAKVLAEVSGSAA
jgi:peroxiredoxin Q/BCP